MSASNTPFTAPEEAVRAQFFAEPATGPRILTLGQQKELLILCADMADLLIHGWGVPEAEHAANVILARYGSFAGSLPEPRP